LVRDFEFMHPDEIFMSEAIILAKQAFAQGEVPVGALVVKDNKVIGRGFNQPIYTSDPTAHAEIVALRDAAITVQNYRLSDCSLYVTIEPCAMCVGAMVHARIQRVIFGATEPRAGSLVSQLKLMDMSHFNHTFEWQGGVLETECGDLMRDFFKSRR
jgi:tRNA(adenine34) deaminase